MKPLREAMEQMAKAQELPKPKKEAPSKLEVITKAAVFSKEK